MKDSTMCRCIWPTLCSSPAFAKFGKGSTESFRPATCHIHMMPFSRIPKHKSINVHLVMRIVSGVAIQVGEAPGPRRVFWAEGYSGQRVHGCPRLLLRQGILNSFAKIHEGLRLRFAVFVAAAAAILITSTANARSTGQLDDTLNSLNFESFIHWIFLQTSAFSQTLVTLVLSCNDHCRCSGAQLRTWSFASWGAALPYGHDLGPCVLLARGACEHVYLSYFNIPSGKPL